MTTERWAVVPGLDGFYEASSQGRLWSYRARGRTPRDARDPVGREVRGTVEKQSGYRLVTVVCDGRERKERMHVLVAAAFLGPRPPGQLVLHENDDPADNRLSNLRYGTFSHNAEDKVRNGRHHATKRTHCPRGHPLEGANLDRWQLARGRRSCLACAKTSQYESRRTRQRGLPPRSPEELDAAADACYAQRMKRHPV